VSQAETWTVGRLLKWTTDFLRKHESESPRLDAEVLLAHARGCQRIELYTAFEEEPPEEIKTRFRELVKKRSQGEPVAYLVGSKEFFSLNFAVTRDVLIPRPETEHLVVAVIDLAKQIHHSRLPAEPSPEQAGDSVASSTAPEPLRIIDLGTGSGCIAITLAKHIPGATITAVDRSPAALEIAQRNAQANGVADRIEFVQSDWFSSFAGTTPTRTWDIVVSNPPYITQAEYAKLAKSVREFEPVSALVSGPEGTEDIQRLAQQAPQYLKAGGYMLVEMSPMIADKVQAILNAAPWKYEKTIKDLAHHARITVARKTM
jgi:release factor glutamine methyltransferase